MSSLAHLLRTPETNHPLRNQFMRWQCRVRQVAMRENMGKPDDAVTPEVTIEGINEPIGHIITVISKAVPYSKVPELQHIFKCTNDPAQKRDKALELFSETYFQKAHEFSDALTSTFSPGSQGARALCDAGACNLVFQAYGHYFDLACAVTSLTNNDPLYQATWWHNAMFNPGMSPHVEILAFTPDWNHSVAELH